MHHLTASAVVVLGLLAAVSCKIQSSSDTCGIVSEGPALSAGQVWINELCSILNIQQYDATTGKFTGTHENSHGVANGVFAVAGYKDPKGNTLGWTLNWENSELDACAVISWSGQTQYLPNGDPVILTTWVVTRQTSFEDNWSSTLIGTDQFYPLSNPPAGCEAKAYSFFRGRVF